MINEQDLTDYDLAMLYAYVNDIADVIPENDREFNDSPVDIFIAAEAPKKKSQPHLILVKSDQA